MKNVIKRGSSQREPLYLQVEDALRREIAGMTAGDRLPPERTLAGQYGVSLITVREAIRILASEGRLERIQGKGTFVREADESAVGHVALLIHHDVSSPHSSSIYLRLAQEIQELLDVEKIPSRLYISRRAPGLEQFDFHCPDFFQDMEVGKIRGVIGVLVAANAPWIDSLAAQGIPMASVGQYKPYGVNVDIREFFASAVEGLLQQDKRRIGLMTWGGFEGDRSGWADIFREILENAGLPIVEPWIKDDIYPTLDGSGWGAFREIWSATLEHPDGLIIADDFFLPGTALAIGEIGIKVPDQLEIVALLSDRSKIEYPFPLIAWQPDIPAIAKAIVETEIQLLRGEKPARTIQNIPPIRLPELDAHKSRKQIFINQKIHQTNQLTCSK